MNQGLKKYAVAVPLGSDKINGQEDTLSKAKANQQIQNDLQQRLIEVLEEEKKIEAVEETPVINKRYFQEVFDKYNHKLKCEAELTSDDNFLPSED